MKETGKWVSGTVFTFVLNPPSLKSIVSAPDSSTEAELLLESAQAKCKLRRIQKQLADQQVQCDLLQLEYSRLQVQRVG